MVVVEMKCNMCGCNFEAEVLDRQDPDEKKSTGHPLRCPKCSGTMLQTIREVRRVMRRPR